MGVPVNMALAQVGIKMGKVPGGDIGYLPMAVIPVSSSFGEQEEQPMQGVEDDTRKVVPFSKPVKKNAHIL